MPTNDNKTPIIGISLNTENVVKSLDAVLHFDTVEPKKYPDSEQEKHYLSFMSNKQITRKGSNASIYFGSFIPIYKSGLIKSTQGGSDGSKPKYEYIFETNNKMVYTFEGECNGLVSNKPRKVKVKYKPILIIGFSRSDNTKPLEEQQCLYTYCIENKCILIITVDDKMCYQYVGDPVPTLNSLVKTKTTNYIKYISADVLNYDIKLSDINMLEQ